MRRARSYRASDGAAKNHFVAPIAATAAAPCATMKPTTPFGAMPAKVSVMDRARVTAGFAKEVEDVNQYAAVM